MFSMENEDSKKTEWGIDRATWEGVARLFRVAFTFTIVSNFIES